jgi:hypothetical protein
MKHLRFAVATLLALATLASCRTTAPSAHFNPYAPVGEPSVSDGASHYVDPGRAQKVRNAFNTFH